jgi:hypothetical protein
VTIVAKVQGAGALTKYLDNDLIDGTGKEFAVQFSPAMASGAGLPSSLDCKP